MRRLFIVILLLVFNTGQQAFCQNKQIERLVDIVINYPTDLYVEFPTLYDAITTVMAEDSTERLILVQLLKRKGFEITNWGRGNFPPLGPRIVSFEMKRKNCKCFVDKIYYLTTSESVYKMTERIKCKSINEY